MFDSATRARFDELQVEFDRLESELATILAAGDQHAARDAGRRHAELKPVVDAWRAYLLTEDLQTEAADLARSETDPEMKDYLAVESQAASEELERIEAELRELLRPRDPNAGRNVIVEIRGAEGGEEGNIWAGDLFRMYQRYADAHRWRLEVLASQPSDLGGYREVTFLVKGEDAWVRLKHEAGPHRVQRVPATESQGRVHTSAATVAVLPEAEELDVHVDPNDLEIDVYRSSGPGGQSVNTTDSAVRITHVPTGVVVTCQDEKSQLQNKDKALRILRARLLQLEQDRQDAALSSARRDQVKGGGRSEKVRTYNYRDNRVTDHRIGLTVHSLDQVLAGQLDDITDALLEDERQRQLEPE